MAILSLKGTLLYWLEQFLFSECEKKESSFTNFSHDTNCSTAKSYNKSGSASAKWLTKWSDIPLKKQATDSAVRYISALPQILIAGDNSECILQDKKTVDDVIIRLSRFQLINTNSQGNYLGNKPDFLSELWAEFKIRTQRPGWIAFELSHKGIENWLRQIQAHSMDEKKNHTFVINQPLSTATQRQGDPSLLQRLLIDSRCDEQWNDHIGLTPGTDRSAQEWLWQAQYTHARCHVLAGYARSAFLDSSQGSDQDSARATEWLHGDLQKLQQAEDTQPSALINALIEMSDAMFWIPYRYPTNQYFLLLKCASQLCQAFEVFHRTQISGFAGFSYRPNEPRNLCLQAQFGLVKITQKVLKILLEQYLDAVAPEHL